MSGEDTQDRTDRLLLTPWVKFLWESYRQCLDLLRNNSKVERLYHDIAQQGRIKASLHIKSLVGKKLWHHQHNNLLSYCVSSGTIFKIRCKHYNSQAVIYMYGENIPLKFQSKCCFYFSTQFNKIVCYSIIFSKGAQKIFNKRNFCH